MKKVAVISNSRVAYEYHAREDMWWFDATTFDGKGALQVVPLSELEKAYQVYHVLSPEDLNKKLCVVDESSGIIKYVEI